MDPDQPTPSPLAPQLRRKAKPTALSPRSRAERQHILEVATRLFGQHGFEETSVKLLASEAEVPTATIYTFFGDKVDLLLEVVTARIAEVVRGAEARVHAGQDPIETLATITRSVNRDFAEDPVLMRLLTFQAHVMGPRSRDHIEHMVQMLDQMALALLLQATQAGQLHCSDPEGLIAVMRFAMQGWLMNALRGADTISEGRLTDALIEVLYLAAGRAPGSEP